ncbi:MAG: LacI family DNA-binding transcriptional regulator [Lachnospiraceae bacterium]|nr:LacI family DNA-binding transcriptional regulator [Lachnospiraceae bacterium]
MTIKDIANIAGVSTAAVSRYLNGGSLSEPKKNAVRKAIEATGYRPSQTARGMRTGTMNQIGIIVPRVHSYSVSQILEGITDAINISDYMPILGCTNDDEQKEIKYAQLMANNHVAGVILMGTMMTPMKKDALKQMEVPLVVTGQNFKGFACVYHDDYHAMEELTQRVIARGRKHICYIGVTERDLQAGLARRQGFEAAIQADGHVSSHVMLADFDAQSGYEAMKEALAENPEIDGVICATGNAANGALQVLYEQKKKVGGNISIAAVEDSWMNQVAKPQLSTAHFYYRQCGQDAAKMLLEQIANPEEASITKQTCLNYSIVDRGSI